MDSDWKVKSESEKASLCGSCGVEPAWRLVPGVRLCRCAPTPNLFPLPLPHCALPHRPTAATGERTEEDLERIEDRARVAVARNPCGVCAHSVCVCVCVHFRIISQNRTQYTLHSTQSPQSTE